MKIGDVKIGEHYKVESRSYYAVGQRVRVDAIERVEQRPYSWSSNVRHVRKLRVTEVGLATGEPLVGDDDEPVTRLISARYLEGLWSEYAERYATRSAANAKAHEYDDRVRDALDRVAGGTFPGHVDTRVHNAEVEPRFETVIVLGGWRGGLRAEEVPEDEIEAFIKRLAEAGEAVNQ